MRSSAEVAVREGRAQPPHLALGPLDEGRQRGPVALPGREGQPARLVHGDQSGGNFPARRADYPSHVVPTCPGSDLRPDRRGGARAPPRAGRGARRRLPGLPLLLDRRPPRSTGARASARPTPCPISATAILAAAGAARPGARAAGPLGSGPATCCSWSPSPSCSIALPALVLGDEAGTTVHLARELGSWDAALAIAWLVVTWAPRRAAGLLPFAVALAAVMVGTALLDVAERPRRALTGEAHHVLDLAGLAMVWLLARVDAEHPLPPPMGRRAPAAPRVRRAPRRPRSRPGRSRSSAHRRPAPTRSC